MNNKKVLAFDLGASGGRGIIGAFDGRVLSLEEVGRFRNGPKQLGSKLFWDFIMLMEHIYGIIGKQSERISSVGIDTWGVDFGLLDQNGDLMGMPRSYRDAAFGDKNRDEMLAAFGGEPALFDLTYVASQRFTVLSKLYWMQQHEPGTLDYADHLLMLPNLIEYYLTGEIHSEYSIASTSQMYDMKNRCWSKELIQKLGVKESLFSPVDMPGHVLGKLKSEYFDGGVSGIQVISVSGHDTACAAAAVPTGDRNYTFLSSGTWSLMGAITDNLLTGQRVIDSKIGNEGAANGAYRPTINITGLWLIQECKRCWNEAKIPLTYEAIAETASKCRPCQCFIDPDVFQAPGNYPDLIMDYCKRTGQYVPQNNAEIARCVFDSLAMKYRESLIALQECLRETNQLYVVGGGVNNRLLNQLTANAVGIPVITGPSEATAVGNIIQQLQTLGEICGAEEAGEVIRTSFASEEFQPQDTDLWDDAYARFLKIREYSSDLKL